MFDGALELGVTGRIKEKKGINSRSYSPACFRVLDAGFPRKGFLTVATGGIASKVSPPPDIPRAGKLCHELESPGLPLPMGSSSAGFKHERKFLVTQSAQCITMDRDAIERLLQDMYYYTRILSVGNLGAWVKEAPRRA